MPICKWLASVSGRSAQEKKSSFNYCRKTETQNKVGMMVLMGCTLAEEYINSEKRFILGTQCAALNLEYKKMSAMQDKAI